VHFSFFFFATLRPSFPSRPFVRPASLPKIFRFVCTRIQIVRPKTAEAPANHTNLRELEGLPTQEDSLPCSRPIFRSSSSYSSLFVLFAGKIRIRIEWVKDGISRHEVPMKLGHSF